MRTLVRTLIVVALAGGATGGRAQEPELALDTVPPVVVRSVPEAGSSDVDPALGAIRVTFSKAMQDGNWSWATVSPESFPELAGQPRYEADGRTCVLPVRLRPGTTYALWINSNQLRNFKDATGRPAVPYLLVFKTKG